MYFIRGLRMISRYDSIDGAIREVCRFINSKEENTLEDLGKSLKVFMDNISLKPEELSFIDKIRCLNLISGISPSIDERAKAIFRRMFDEDLGLSLNSCLGKLGLPEDEFANIQNGLASLELTPQEIDEIFHVVDPLIKEGMGGVVDILRAVKDIPKREREKVCKGAALLIRQGMKGCSEITILTELKKIEADERESTCLGASLLIKKRMHSAFLGLILKHVKDIPRVEREAVCRAAAPFIKEGMGEIFVFSILRAVKDILEGEREVVCQKAALFIKEGMSGETVTSILHAVKDISKEEREELCNAAAPFIQECMGLTSLPAILRAVKDIPKGEREEMYKLAPHLIKREMNGASVAAILRAVKDIPKEQRAELCRAAGPLIKEWSDGETVVGILRILKDLPLGEIEEVRKMASVFTIGRVPGDLLVGIFETVSLWKKEGSIGSLQSALRHCFGQIIESLMEDESNSTKLTNIISYIENNQQLFDLADEDPLTALMIQVRFAINPHMQDETDNMYVVHRRLLARKHEPVDLPSISFRYKEGDFKANFNAVLSDVKLAKAKLLTFGDLSRDYLKVQPNGFLEFFTRLEARYQTLSTHKKIEYDAELEIYGSFREIKTRCDGLFSRIRYWMNFTSDDPEKVVPAHTAKLYALLDNVLKQSADLEEGHVFSGQESAFLGLLLSINRCATGQDEGIAVAYSCLPRKVKEDIITSYTSLGKEVVHNFLASLVLEGLSHVEASISKDCPLMRDLLLEEPSFEQLVHQTLYLKNLLFEDLGFDHTIILDRHSGWIDKSLRDKSKEEILAVIAKHSMPDLLGFLVDKLKNAIGKMVDPDKTSRERATRLYNAILSFLEEKGIPAERVYSYDEEIDRVEFKEEGALILLEKMGYIDKD